MPDADPDTEYIKVTLARPVPAHGQARIVIVKTYKDQKSYHADGTAIVFERPLGVKRNKVVLPAGLRGRRAERALADSAPSRTGASR